MSQTKLFDDVTTRRVLDKLIPTDSLHNVQMRQLVIDVISLVQDDDIGLLYLKPGENFAELTGIDCEDVIKEIIRQGKTVEWAVTYMLIVFYQAYGEVNIYDHSTPQQTLCQNR